MPNPSLRSPSPSPVNICKGPNGCGHDVLASELGKAEHAVQHILWQRTYQRGPIPPEASMQSLVAAYERYVAHLDAHAKRLQVEINVRDEVIESLEHDLRFEQQTVAGLTGELSTARDRAAMKGHQ